MEPTDKNNASILLRLPEDLKAALQREAFASGRRITSEINTRLRDSLKKPTPGIAPSAPTSGTKLPPSYTAGHAPALVTNDNGPASALSGTDQAMLQIFRAMPPEKQLALLSLFK